MISFVSVKVWVFVLFKKYSFFDTLYIQRLIFGLFPLRKCDAFLFEYVSNKQKGKEKE